MEESKIYLLKRVMLGKSSKLRKITFVCRQKQFYQKSSIGIWWRKYTGLGINGESDKQIKYFLLGLSFLNILCWVEFKWLGQKNTIMTEKK